MAAETQTGFEIDGEIYEVPTIDSFNMDEAQVMYDYSGLTIEDFGRNPTESEEEAEERSEKFKNPGVIRALSHIAYQRGNPKVKPARVKELIGKANMIDTYMVFADDEVEPESPLASTTEQEQSSQKSSVESKQSSGNASTTASDPPDSQPVTTGTGRSDTSSPESAPKMSVA